MHRLIRCCTVLLTGAMPILMTTGVARAQVRAVRPAPVSFDLGLTYSAEYARIVNQNCSCFWLQGVSGDVSVNFYHGLGLDVALNEGMATNIQPGVNLNKFTVAAGPRYTWSTAKRKPKHPMRFFVEGLGGMAYGSNSVFPATGGSTTTANSYSIQLGGGADLQLKRGFGLRLAQFDWIRTALPNAAANTQDDVRFGVGLSYHFK